MEFVLTSGSRPEKKRLTGRDFWKKSKEE